MADERIDIIAKAVASALNRAVTLADAATDLSKSATEAGQATIGEREKTLIRLAAHSHDGAWTLDDISVGIDKAVAQRNAKLPGSIATYQNEIQVACHPSVRQHVGKLFALAADAWDAEGKAIKAAPKGTKVAAPLRKAYARKYHMVVTGAFKACRAGEVPSVIADYGVMAERVLRARELDHAKAWRTLKAYHDQIKAFAEDFPVEGLADVAEFLHSCLYKDNKPTLDEFKACVETTAASVVATAPEPEAPSSGDILDDALGDITA